MSFGADEDAGGEQEEAIFKKKAIFRPDCKLQILSYSILLFVLNGFFFLAVIADPQPASAMLSFVAQPTQSSGVKSNDVVTEVEKNSKVS